MSSQPIPKYRPALSATQIETIMHLCKTTMPLTNETLSVIATLAPFQAKIQNRGITAAYTAAPVQSMEEKLGLVDFTNHVATTPEDRRKAAYNKYLANPASCSINEIEMANTYRYENGMMSAEEKLAFERGE